MSVASGWTRRRFLVATSAVGTTALAGTAIYWSMRDTWTERLVQALGDSPATREIGRVFVAAHPDQARPEELREGLQRSFAAGDRARPLRDALADKIEEDYRFGRVAQVEDWVLSETEIRLCALAALAADG